MTGIGGEYWVGDTRWLGAAAAVEFDVPGARAVAAVTQVGGVALVGALAGPGRRPEVAAARAACETEGRGAHEQRTERDGVEGGHRGADMMRRFSAQ